LALLVPAYHLKGYQPIALPFLVRGAEGLHRGVDTHYITHIPSLPNCLHKSTFSWSQKSANRLHQ
jgi:hypothetical protein